MKKVLALVVVGLTLVSCSSTPQRVPSSKKDAPPYGYQDKQEQTYKQFNKVY